MKVVLERHLGKTVGLNIDKPFKIEAVRLVSVAERYFTVVDSHQEYTHHFSYHSIVQIIENKDGVDIGGLFTHKDHFEMVIKVGHILQYVPG